MLVTGENVNMIVGSTERDVVAHVWGLFLQQDRGVAKVLWGIR